MRSMGRHLISIIFIISRLEQIKQIFLQEQKKF